MLRDVLKKAQQRPRPLLECDSKLVPNLSRERESRADEALPIAVRLEQELGGWRTAIWRRFEWRLPSSDTTSGWSRGRILENAEVGDRVEPDCSEA